MKFTVSASPHIKSKITTQKIMLDVIIALIPAVIASVLIFGFYPLVVIMVAVASAVFSEWLYNFFTKKQNTTNDLSAIVTGLLLGLNLPPVLPLYVPVIGSIFAIIIVKMLFGGIGKNFANPAITARIFLMLAWASVMTKFVAPINLAQGGGELFKYFGLSQEGLNAITSATPLSFINSVEFVKYSVLDMFLGIMPGTAGEVSALAILLGGLYLIVRRVIDYKIPLIYIAVVGFLTSTIKLDINYFLPSIFSGGLMLGAFFMATDYATSPNSKVGVIIYAVGLGVLTVLIRLYANLPEGVSYAILLMNILTPLLDKWVYPHWFGFVQKRKTRKEEVKA